MTDKQHHCQSYTEGEQICRDGFPVNAACSGYRCHACGGWSAGSNPPACMREDFAPKHLIDDAGMPRLAARGWPTSPLMDADGDIVHPPAAKETTE